MTRLADVEKQIVDKYEELKGKAVGEFDKNLVAHLLGDKNFPRFREVDYALASQFFDKVKIQGHQRGRFWQTVTRSYHPEEEEVKVEEHLVLGAMPIAYERRGCPFMLDLTLDVFKELRLTPAITGDAHIEERGRYNNLNMYVLDRESGLTVQVMDDSSPPQKEFLKVPWHIRYSAEFREKEKSLPAEEFRQYWQKLVQKDCSPPSLNDWAGVLELEFGKADLFAGLQSAEIMRKSNRTNFAPIFKYYVGNEALAVKAMLLYGARNLMAGLQHEIQFESASAEHKKQCESALPILEERLAEIRKLPTP